MSKPTKASGRVTQEDVACVAGVSQALVSYVVNDTANDRPIPAETRQRVKDAVAELGYIPNVMARRLRLSKTSTVAGVIPDITNPFYPEFQRGIQDSLLQHDYDLITYNTDGTAQGEQRCLDSLLQGRVDGVVAVFFNLRAMDLKALLDRRIAVVRLEARPKRQGPLPLDNLFIDNAAAGRTATEHLIDLGHSRIAMLTSDEGPAAVREAGYLEALEEVGVGREFVTKGSYSHDGGYRAMNRLLGRDPRPTAVVAANDLMALGAMVAIREAGLRIPEDVAVVGFDDIPVARLVHPSLTTIAQSQREIGRRAAQMVMDRIEGRVESAGLSVEMPYRLVERESTRGLSK